MPDLPHGWRMRNSQGEKLGPPIEEDGNNYQFSGSDNNSNSNGDDSESEPDIHLAGLDLKPDSEGWDDVEDDTEDISIKCLFCEEGFAGAKAMNEHSKGVHGFDLAEVQVKHDLDFYSSMKLINYIRAQVQVQVQAGGVQQTKVDVSDASAWADDKWLQPTLEDDALLFNLDDIDERPVKDEKSEGEDQDVGMEGAADGQASSIDAVVKG